MHVPGYKRKAMFALLLDVTSVIQTAYTKFAWSAVTVQRRFCTVFGRKLPKKC
jgi:hypothetical protein